MTIPYRKIFEQEDAWIQQLRRERNFGARRIQQELRRQRHHCHVDLEATHTTLKRHGVPPLRRPRRPQVSLRYNTVPGERVQMDALKLAPGLNQYTLILGARRRISLTSSGRSYDIPFPVQWLKTNNGTEFMATKGTGVQGP